MRQHCCPFVQVVEGLCGQSRMRAGTCFCCVQGFVHECVHTCVGSSDVSLRSGGCVYPCLWVYTSPRAHLRHHWASTRCGRACVSKCTHASVTTGRRMGLGISPACATLSSCPVPCRHGLPSASTEAAARLSCLCCCPSWLARPQGSRQPCSPGKEPAGWPAAAGHWSGGLSVPALVTRLPHSASTWL